MWIISNNALYYVILIFYSPYVQAESQKRNTLIFSLKLHLLERLQYKSNKEKDSSLFVLKSRFWIQDNIIYGTHYDIRCESFETDY